MRCPEDVEATDKTYDIASHSTDVDTANARTPPVSAAVESTTSEDMMNETVDNNFDPICLSMLNRVASSNAFFKQQVLTEPDLTFFEKFTIASDLLNKKPATFLERYGKYLTQSDLSYFEPFRDDYFVDFHVRKLNQSISTVRNEYKKVKNRRYEAMKRLLSEGEYFSDDEMRKRDPLLFDEMIGQYQTSDDVADAVAKSDLSLSNILLQRLQCMQNNELYEEQINKRDAATEEFDSDDDGEEETEAEAEPSESEKAALRSEFVEIMQQRFLSGQDRDFNYCEIDNNEDYDSIDLFGRDEEDRYFAGDDSDNDCSGDSQVDKNDSI